jgi:hypothetical protein
MAVGIRYTRYTVLPLLRYTTPDRTKFYRMMCYCNQPIDTLQTSLWRSARRIMHHKPNSLCSHQIFSCRSREHPIRSVPSLRHWCAACLNNPCQAGVIQLREQVRSETIPPCRATCGINTCFLHSLLCGNALESSIQTQSTCFSKMRQVVDRDARLLRLYWTFSPPIGPSGCCGSPG